MKAAASLLLLFLFVPATTVCGTLTYLARCDIHPDVTNGPPSLAGIVFFSQKVGLPLYVSVRIWGLPVWRQQLQGIHVHEFPVHAVGRPNCSEAGAHFNPFGREHGGLFDTIRHVGDLGNIVINGYGSGRVDLISDLPTITGRCAITNIIGRTFMLHSMEDDLGRGGNPESKKTGNAGSRLGCCVINSVY